MSKLGEYLKRKCTPGMVKWNIKLLLGVAVFFAVGIGVTAILKNWEILRGFSHVFDNTVFQVGTPARMFSFIGTHNAFGLLPLVLLFVIGYFTGMKPKLATARDFLAVYFFTAFSAMLLVNLGGLHAKTVFEMGASFDLTLIAGLFMSYMIVVMSSLGWTLESNKFMARELLTVFLLVGLGSLPDLIRSSFSSAAMGEILFEVVIIHFLGILIKIIVFSEAVLGFHIKSEAGALLLGLLLLLVGLPFAALVVSSVFCFVIYLLVGIWTGAGISTALPVSSLYFPFQVPAAFISHIVRSGPLPALFFFLSFFYYMTGFGKEYARNWESDSDGEDKDPAEKFDINRTRINWLYFVLGVPALVFAVVWIARDGKNQYVTRQTETRPVYRPLTAAMERRRPIAVFRSKRDVSPQNRYRIWTRSGQVCILLENGYKELVRIRPERIKPEIIDMNTDTRVKDFFPEEVIKKTAVQYGGALRTLFQDRRRCSSRILPVKNWRDLFPKGSGLVLEYPRDGKMVWTIPGRDTAVRMEKGELCVFSRSSGDLEIFNVKTGHLLLGRNLGRLFYLLHRDVKDGYDSLPFVRHGEYLYCTTGIRATPAKVDLKTGKTVWESEPFPQPVYNGIAVTGGRVYIIDILQNIYVFSAE